MCKKSFSPLLPSGGIKFMMHFESRVASHGLVERSENIANRALQLVMTVLYLITNYLLSHFAGGKSPYGHDTNGYVEEN